ncbi:rhodanese-related sulfurtransferase/DNA-binding transcriptional ArsR family regulator [Spinactinospora alkalitolerans]|uniref:Rhodanese-related sulfurtransferase/DNA-binding transcriptional ArsR family regulator n=1 Tax=Spinactinospora alkalitolerans TaxID=687207 RepID=A0A852TVY7_9ACTN|nr:ArsR family transcriptional regulator [Spinactinospora alkalitolerans]NYE46040.1 rhodanese-related sulfurtransferase/DNA-binding transcriptional ArsR family regulator [Spinactinospora alkalitolerans]
MRCPSTAGVAEEPVYAQLARIGKALSRPVRLRLLDQKEYTVEQLAEEAGIPLKNTSAQSQQRLRGTNLVTGRKEGTRVHHRTADPGVSEFLGRLQDFAEDRLADLRDAVAARLGDPAVMRPMKAAELRERFGDPGLVVIDVRPAEDYAAGHVPDAASVPMEELHERPAGLPRDAEIVAYCQGPYCVVSPEAVRLLREHGYRARPLDGGFTRWNRA